MDLDPLADPRPRSAQIVGWGMAVPERVVTNHDLEKVMETTDGGFAAAPASPNVTSLLDTERDYGQPGSASRPRRAAHSRCAGQCTKSGHMRHLHPGIRLSRHCLHRSECTWCVAHGRLRPRPRPVPASSMAFPWLTGAILAGDADYVLVIGSETMSRLVGLERPYDQHSIRRRHGRGAAGGPAEEPGRRTCIVLGF